MPRQSVQEVLANTNMATCQVKHGLEQRLVKAMVQKHDLDKVVKFLPGEVESDFDVVAMVSHIKGDGVDFGNHGS